MKISFIVQLGNTNRVFRHKYGDTRDYQKKKSKLFYYTLHKISRSSTTKLETDIELIRVILFPHISPSSPLRHEMNVMINFFLRGYSLVIVREKCSQWSKSEALPLFLHSVAPGGSGSPPLEENSTYSWHRPFRRKDCTPGEVVVRGPLCG